MSGGNVMRAKHKKLRINLGPVVICIGVDLQDRFAGLGFWSGIDWGDKPWNYELFCISALIGPLDIFIALDRRDLP